MAASLGIVAGGGPLPGQLVAACRRNGREVFVLALEGFTDAANLTDVPHEWVRLGAAGKAIAALHRAGVEEVVLVGPVRRPTLAELRPDLRAMRVLASGVLNRGDDGLLRAIVRVLEDEEGFRVIGTGDVAGDLLPGPGVLGRHAPDEGARRDVMLGVAVVRAVGRLDVGQAAVVQQGLVLGIEAAEGTARLISRCAELKRPGRGGVLVKLVKPGQENRADLPTIGADTAAQAAAAGLVGIAVGAGATQLLQRERLIAAADEAGLFVWAFDPADFPEADGPWR